MIDEQKSAAESIVEAFNAEAISDALAEAKRDLEAHGKSCEPRAIVRRTLEMAVEGVSLVQGRAKSSYARGMEANAKQMQGQHIKWLTSPEQFLQDWGGEPKRHFTAIERFKNGLPDDRKRRFERSEIVIRILMHRDFIVRGAGESNWRNAERDHEIVVLSAQGWLSQSQIGAAVMRWREDAGSISREQVRKILNQNWDDIARRCHHLMHA